MQKISKCDCPQCGKTLENIDNIRPYISVFYCDDCGIKFEAKDKPKPMNLDRAMELLRFTIKEAKDISVLEKIGFSADELIFDFGYTASTSHKKYNNKIKEIAKGYDESEIMQ